MLDEVLSIHPTIPRLKMIPSDQEDDDEASDNLSTETALARAQPLPEVSLMSTSSKTSTNTLANMSMLSTSSESSSSHHESPGRSALDINDSGGMRSHLGMLQKNDSFISSESGSSSSTKGSLKVNGAHVMIKKMSLAGSTSSTDSTREKVWQPLLLMMLASFYDNV